MSDRSASSSEWSRLLTQQETNKPTSKTAEMICALHNEIQKKDDIISRLQDEIESKDETISTLKLGLERARFLQASLWTDLQKAVNRINADVDG